MRKPLFIFLFCLMEASVFAFTLSPEAKISLLTCAPGEEVYARFGHTAIRVNDAPNSIDEVFNYGIFDFNAESFLYRFVKGETDYILGTTDFNYFVWEYESRHSAVVEQVLNLTGEERQSLFDALMLNALPENRTYRYNYFFDNCSTRPRIMIENAVISGIIYSPFDTSNTFRRWISEYVGRGTWLEFGIDLLIGGRADLPQTGNESLFLPDNLMLAFGNAQVSRGGETQPLVAEQHFVTSPSPALPEGEGAGLRKQFPSFGGLREGAPFITCWLLFFVVLLLTGLFYKKNKRGVWLDMLLFGAVGLAGCVIAFLVFFSVHPAVSPNWNLLWAHPLHLLFALTLPFKSLQKWQRYYHFANTLVLLGTLIFYAFIPQLFNPAFFPLILCLLLCSLVKIKTNKR